MRTPEQIIAELKMKPIPDEGAWFVEGPRTQGLSSILVLLTAADDGFSAMHRLGVDEGWQWLEGAPAALLRLKEGPRRNHGTLTPARPRSAGRCSCARASGRAPRRWASGACSRAGAARRSGPSTSPSATATTSRAFPAYAAEIAALTRPHPAGPAGRSAGGHGRLLTCGFGPASNDTATDSQPGLSGRCGRLPFGGILHTPKE